MNALRVIDLVTTDNNKKFEPAGRMAAAIIQITQEQGGCLPQDLNTRGFTSDDVAAHWDMARSLAAVELNLLSSAPVKKNISRKI